MNRTVLYIVLLGVLGFGVYFFIFKEHNAFGVDEAGFRIKDTGEITRIYLADKKGNAISLRRNDTGWTLNERYKAIDKNVKNLLSTLAEQDAQYPAPKGTHNAAVTILAGNGIKVELYGKNNKKIRVFYVGGQVNTNDGSYMLMEGATQPYIVQIPAFTGYLTPRYSTNIADWRDRTIFDVPETELRSVAVTYPFEPLNSFTLLRDNSGKLSVKLDSALIAGKPFNDRRAQSYARFFADMYAEGYVNGAPDVRAAIRTVPMRCIIEVENTAGSKQRAEIYWMPVSQRSKTMLTPNPSIQNGFDGDRAYAVINDYKDTVIIQYVSFDKLFRKAYEFYEADQQTKPADTQPEAMNYIN